MQLGVEMDLGQVLRSMVLVARHTLGACWPSRVALLFRGAHKALMTYVSRQPASFPVVTVLESESHWAVCAHSGASCVLYDGLRDPVVRDQACAVRLHLQELKGYSAETTQLQTCKLPHQPDGWSCGHRAVATFKKICSNIVEGQPLPVELACCDLNIKDLVGWCLEQHETTRSIPGTPPQQKKKRKSLSCVSSQKTKAPKTDGSESKKEGERVALLWGVPHKVFQKVHYENKCVPEQGHWSQFLTALACHSGHSCLVCKHLASRISEAQQAAAKEKTFSGMAAEHEKEAAHAPSVHAGNLEPSLSESPSSSVSVGEPGANLMESSKDAAPPKVNLREWIRNNRSDIYDPLPPMPGKKLQYWCKICHCALQFQCNGTLDYVKLHEGRKKHQRALQAPGTNGEAAVLTGECPGVDVADSRNPIHALRDSVQNWVQGGQPKLLDTPGCCSPLSRAEFIVLPNGEICIRSSKCIKQKPFEARMCPECEPLAASKELLQEIAKWSFRIDMCTLAWKMTQGHACEQEQLQLMQGKDYCAFGVADDLRLFSDPSRSCLQKIRLIQHKFHSIPRSRRNPSLTHLMDFYLCAVPHQHSSDPEVQAHAVLAQSMTQAGHIDW